MKAMISSSIPVRLHQAKWQRDTRNGHITWLKGRGKANIWWKWIGQWENGERRKERDWSGINLSIVSDLKKRFNLQPQLWALFLQHVFIRSWAGAMKNLKYLEQQKRMGIYAPFYRPKFIISRPLVSFFKTVWIPLLSTVLKSDWQLEN